MIHLIRLAVVISSVLALQNCARVIEPPEDVAFVNTTSNLLPDSLLIQAVLRGERSDANASWWGFSETNATSMLQDAINSGAKVVFVPKMGQPWTVDPLFLASNQEIVFERGVTVLARKGSFKGRFEDLVAAEGKENIIIRGYGAKFEMRREDYVGPEYVRGEWRHCLALHGAKNIRIYGLRLVKAGGDGLFIGEGPDNFCSNILIQDVECDSNYRQGISVISAKGLTIENCRLTNTYGTAPQAGIDLEPDAPYHQLVDCTIRGCYITGNRYYGIVVSMIKYDSSSTPVSIRIEECWVSENSDGSQMLALAIVGPAPQFTNKLGTVYIVNNNLFGLQLFRNTSGLSF
jgi:hypothetical protein